MKKGMTMGTEYSRISGGSKKRKNTPLEWLKSISLIVGLVVTLCVGIGVYFKGRMDTESRIGNIKVEQEKRFGVIDAKTGILEYQATNEFDRVYKRFDYIDRRLEHIEEMILKLHEGSGHKDPKTVMSNPGPVPEPKYDPPSVPMILLQKLNGEMKKDKWGVQHISPYLTDKKE